MKQPARSPTTRTRLAEARQAALSALTPASQAFRRAVQLLGRLRKQDDERQARERARELERDSASQRGRDDERERAFDEAHAAVARWGGDRDESDGDAKGEGRR